jgi:hypothetical protein
MVCINFEVSDMPDIPEAAWYFECHPGSGEHQFEHNGLMMHIVKALPKAIGNDNYPVPLVDGSKADHFSVEQKGPGIFLVKLPRKTKVNLKYPLRDEHQNYRGITCLVCRSDGRALAGKRRQTNLIIAAPMNSSNIGELITMGKQMVAEGTMGGVAAAEELHHWALFIPSRLILGV